MPLLKKYSARLCTYSQGHLITWEAPFLGVKAGIVTLDAYNRRNKSIICDGKLIWLGFGIVPRAAALIVRLERETNKKWGLDGF